MRSVSLAGLSVGILLAVLALPGTATAELPCTELLQRRAIDLRETRSFDDRVAHVRDVLCRRDYADITDFRKVDEWAGGTLGRAMQAYGFRGDGLSWQLARQEMCSPRARAGEKFKPYFVDLRAADRGLMTAFRRCLVGSQHVELWVEADPADIARWRLSAFNRHPQGARAPRFLGLNTSPEPDLCTVESGFVAGQVFREDRALCHHSTKGTTSVVISGDRPVGQITIQIPK